MLPRPGYNRPQVFACLDRSAAWIRSFVRNCSVANPIAEFADLLSTKQFNWNSAAPRIPLGARRAILSFRAWGRIPGTEISSDGGSERNWHLVAPVPPTLASMLVPHGWVHCFPCGLPRPVRGAAGEEAGRSRGDRPVAILAEKHVPRVLVAFSPLLVDVAS